MSPSRAIARRVLADSRTRTVWFAVFFALVAIANVAGYRSSYKTAKERLAFAHSFGDNKAVRLFYGKPHDLLTVSGYAAWRVAGVLTIFAAVWGMLAAMRALRAEEDAGRQELVLATPVSRRTALRAALVAIAAGATLIWAATFLALVAGRLPVGGSAYLALAIVSPLPVFVGVGALASQVAPARRLALEIAAAALAATLLLRVVADTSASLDWLRWLTPLGWAEELRPFTGGQPLVLLLPAAATALLLWTSLRLALGRDIGSGLLPVRDSAPPRTGLLGSPTAQALRSERGSLIGWVGGVGFFALVIGLISHSVSSANIPASLEQELRKVGGASITTPAGALGFYFLLFVLAVSLFACAQLVAARREEADGRLETLFAFPVARHGWLAGRLLLALAGSAAVAFAAGILAWVGAASQGVDISPARMLEAGLNCLPTAALFLGIGALGFAAVPRMTAGIAYGLVSLAFVWELFGALLGAPRWVLGLSPFHHVGLVPAQPFKVTAALVMVAIAAAAAAVSLWLFRRRDLAGA